MNTSGTEEISWQDFEKVDLRAGTVIEVQEYPEARKPAYKIRVDFGALGIRISSAQVTVHYKPEELIGRQIVGVVNFPKKQIGKFMSEFLITGFEDEHGAIVLTTLERPVPNGSRLK